MNFNPQTQEELKKLNIENEKEYKIKFLNRDYFNGEENLETTIAKAIVNEDGNISFIIQDDYGMDKFINNVEVLNQ